MIDRVTVCGYYGDGIISKFTWGRYRHVAYKFYKSDGTVEKWHATLKGGVHKETDFTNEARHRELEIPLDETQRMMLYVIAVGYDKVPYDRKAILGFVFRKNSQDPDKFICSEYVIQCLREMGVRVSRRPAHKESPQTVMDNVYFKAT